MSWAITGQIRSHGTCARPTDGRLQQRRRPAGEPNTIPTNITNQSRRQNIPDSPRHLYYPRLTGLRHRIPGRRGTTRQNRKQKLNSPVRNRMPMTSLPALTPSWTVGGSGACGGSGCSAARLERGVARSFAPSAGSVRDNAPHIAKIAYHVPHTQLCPPSPEQILWTRLKNIRPPTSH